MKLKTLAVFAVSLFLSTLGYSQIINGNFEKYPVFKECEGIDASAAKSCFNQTLISKIKADFKVPQYVIDEKYSGDIVVLFEVTKEGDFEVLNVTAVYEDLREEIKKIFNSLPQVKPATYNGRATYMQFSMPIPISALLDKENSDLKYGSTENLSEAKPIDQLASEYDSIKTFPFENREYDSQLFIPFSHQTYSRFDKEMNAVGTNSHTSTKPFIYSDVNRYYNFKEKRENLYKEKRSWFGRKLWNEHMVTLQGDDYWFTLDPAADLQLGFETADNEDQSFTYNNTRAVIFQGGLGKKLNFYTVFYESQGSFAGYFNRYARSIAPDGGNPAIVPGRGIAAEAADGNFDYPVAEAYLSYSPSQYFNFQFGHGKNFIGDGYRSLLLSDNASPYPFFKMSTTFWKFKYTNTWMSLRDVRSDVVEDGSFRTKFMANHYLSFNATKRLNIGLFENVIWTNDNDRGVDLNYLNPIIFYRAIEFSTGSRGGNALIGLSAKYKFSDHFNAYAQVIIDEFSTGAVFSSTKSYQNKQGVQVGFKYYDAFNIENLQLQFEFNQVRPYVYSNNEIVLNYGHNNQSMAHLWGANFREFIAIARYQNDRWYGAAKAVYGKRGFEVGDIDNIYYGGSIYGNDENIPSEFGIEIGQGNAANTFIGNVELGYIVNPSTNFKIYTNVLYRNNAIAEFDAVNLEESTVWVNFGIRTDIFNWYFDY
ncbi:gliding motility protein RemB [Leeuwenhoekiella polynyae]|uniref:Protein involved in gliding motility RemB n=1 Tax=Leeuwenhoekiella polynyae TaxID=1550906 RepID=A0A4Q0P1P5_9FLAO|nr:gliding motility protein RemB [Leeuwenhoekiella polynyae]RXG18576.1 protein involved in gliding motility RemB [Leeuwenhoekiella polynyae]